ncbi:MAG: putative homoserine dehydrogenase-like protein [Acidimicrobiales bacterium]|jgi:predicted homoserine dehydrogenase-like protein
MIIVDSALREREANGNPVRIALSGAGFAAQGLIMQLTKPFTVGLELCVIANRTMETIHQVLANLEITDFVEVADAEQLSTAMDAGRLAITTDPILAASAEGIEVLVEATGEIEHGCRVVMAAIDAGKHIVLVNAELDATLGPILKTYADAKGVVFTDTDGDQPGVLMNLKRQVEMWGMRPLMLGNIKSLLDHYRTPTTQAEFAANVWQRPKMITSFADGSKIAFEMATLANGTGFGVMERGMRAPEVRKQIEQAAAEAFDADELINGPGYVDYIIGAEPSFGVFILGTTDDMWLKRYMKVYKMGEGPLYTFYQPYHQSPLETPATIGRVACFGDAALTPLGAPVTDVIAMAKKDCEAGEALDGIGGFTVYGVMENSGQAREEDLLPQGLSDLCVLRTSVSKDEPITIANIERPSDSLAWKLWDEQMETFG